MGAHACPAPPRNEGEERRAMADRLPEVPGGPHLRTVAMPRDSNAGGDVFGGWTLSQMDLACGTFAAERAGGRVATVAIEAMRFLRSEERRVGKECRSRWSAVH